MKKKLTIPDSADRKFLGVCAGIADYLSIDVTIVRIAAVLAAFIFGIGCTLFAYVIAAIVIPDEDTTKSDTTDDTSKDDKSST